MVDPLRAMRGNLRAFYRLFGEGSPGGAVVERDGVLAAIVPVCPGQSMVNGVVYRDPTGLMETWEELEAAYRGAGVRSWRVWVPESDSELADWLQTAGHRRVATSRAMTLGLRGAGSDGPGGLDWQRTTDTGVVAGLNEQAYGLPAGEFKAALAALAGNGVRHYLARDRGQPACCLTTVDDEGDCGIYYVATRPASRGLGLASGLMRRALADAWQRGCISSSLQASKEGFGVYERIGYRDVGAIDSWELQLA